MASWCTEDEWYTCRLVQISGMTMILIGMDGPLEKIQNWPKGPSSCGEGTGCVWGGESRGLNGRWEGRWGLVGG